MTLTTNSHEWSMPMSSSSNFRTDDLPAGSGPFIIENDRRQWWVVTREYVWRLGGGEGSPHSDEIRREVGPWRYVSVPLPSDLQRGQTNATGSPELRRSLHASSDRFPQRTVHEELLLADLPQDDSKAGSAR